MNLLLLSVLTILLCIPVLAQQSFKPDLSKENIKKVHVYRVNRYYNGNRSLDREKSSRGLLIVDFFQPRNSWAVYWFDIKELINVNYEIINQYSKYLVTSKNKLYDKIYKIGSATIIGDEDLLDTLFTRKLLNIDTLTYLDYIVDTALHSGYGTKPELSHYTLYDEKGVKTRYYIKSADMIKSWTDPMFYNLCLVDDCSSSLQYGYHKLLLPSRDNMGYIDTVTIKEIVLDGLSHSSNVSAPLHRNTYNSINLSEYCISGYIIFMDEENTLYFASGDSIFEIDKSLLNVLQKKNIQNLGNSFILSKVFNGKVIYRLFNSTLPSGIDIKDISSAFIYDNLSKSCDDSWCISERQYYTYVKTDVKHYILNLIDGTTLDLSPTWKLVKSLDGVLHKNEVKSKEIKNHFYKYASFYSNKLVFKIPQDKVMIYDYGMFYELTKERMSNPEKRESGDAP